MSARDHAERFFLGARREGSAAPSLETLVALCEEVARAERERCAEECEREQNSLTVAVAESPLVQAAERTAARCARRIRDLGTET